MNRTRFVLIATSAALACAVSLAEAAATPAQGQSQPPTQGQAKPDPKPEAKPESGGFAGKWNVSVETPNGTTEAFLDLKVDAKDSKKVGGVISSQMGESKLEGEIADAKLTFWFTMDANGQSINVTFKGSQQKDGTLAGTLDYGQGEVPWKATRAKN